VKLLVVYQDKINERTETDALLLLYVSFLNMFILFDSTSFIVIIVFKKFEFNRLKDKKNKYSLIIIDTNMWFISRCISVDSLNSCFQQQKNKMSYDFGLCNEGADIFPIR